MSSEHGYEHPSRTRRAIIDAASSLYDMTNNYASPRLDSGSKRGILAGATASLLGVGLDRLEAGGSAKGYYTSGDGSGGRKEDTRHFSDRLITKLLSNAIPSDEREKLDKKMNDEYRADKPGLSIRTLTRNFKNLSYKMDVLFAIQYGIVHFFKWKSPSLTILVLVLYSWGCIDPYMFLVYPLWCILIYILIPNYLYRHPLDETEILEVRGRGSSMFGFLKEDSEWRKEHEELERRRLKFEEIIASNEYMNSIAGSSNVSDTESEFDDASLSTATIADILNSEVSANNDSKESLMTTLVTTALLKEDERRHKEEEDNEEDELKTTKESKAAKVSSKINLLINMRDLQNLTTDIVKMIDGFESFIYEAASFVDEKKSTQLFYHVVSLVAVVFLCGPYIPWRMLFILAAWIGMLAIHPQKAEVWKTLSGTSDVNNDIIEGEPPHVAALFNNDDVAKTEAGGEDLASKLQNSKKDKKPSTQSHINNSIIIDENSQYGECEIFEVQHQGITSYHYKPFAITNQVFNESSSLRVQKKRPKSVPMLSMVQPPYGWIFRGENQWEVDQNPLEWCVARGLEQEMHVKADEQEGWAYDTSREYRRRRMVRVCVVTVRPPRRRK